MRQTCLPLIVSLALAAACTTTHTARPSPAWVATWLVAQQDYNEHLPGAADPLRAPLTLANQTLRQVMHLSLGGSVLRIQLSNRLGSAPVTFAAAHVARSQGAGAVDLTTDETVTFAGAASVTLGAGEEKWSDDLALDVKPHSDWAVSLFVAAPAPIATVHLIASQTNHIAAGDQTGAAKLTDASEVTSTFWLSAAQVWRADQPRVIVAFGDSLTDGAESTVDANQRWPNHFDTRLSAQPSLGPFSVVNAGIGGNRWLHEFIGPRGNNRFAHDVLGVPGVTDVVIWMGVNDIGVSVFVPGEAVLAEDIEAAISAAVSSARAQGLHVAVGTLLPYGGSMYFTDVGEAVRQAVNTWIRGNSGFHVLDFDAAMRDPVQPNALRAADDSGDHLHLNDAGYQRLAQSVDLAFLSP